MAEIAASITRRASFLRVAASHERILLIVLWLTSVQSCLIKTLINYVSRCIVLTCIGVYSCSPLDAF